MKEHTVRFGNAITGTYRGRLLWYWCCRGRCRCHFLFFFFSLIIKCLSRYCTIQYMCCFCLCRNKFEAVHNQDFFISQLADFFCFLSGRNFSISIKISNNNNHRRKKASSGFCVCISIFGGSNSSSSNSSNHHHDSAIIHLSYGSAFFKPEVELK